MRTWSTGIALLLIAAIPPAAASQARSTEPARRGPIDLAPPNIAATRRMFGCYTVSIGAWSVPSAHGGHIPVPTRAELDTGRHQSDASGFGLVARTPGFAVPRQTRFAPAWSPVGADSLQFALWSNGTSMVVMFLRRHGDGVLRGSARYFTDAIALDSTGRWMWETYPAAPATLTRAPCAPREP